MEAPPSLCFLNRLELMEPFSELDPFAQTCRLSEFVLSQETLPKDKLVVRVYQGGAASQQYVAWLQAWLEWKTTNVGGVVAIDLEILTCKDVKEKGYLTPEKLVDFLLFSHVHFILAHIHQGIEGLQWDMGVLYKQQLMRLYYHPGFPSGEQLLCPVFTQDKFRYLSVLSAGLYANPTLKITVSSLVESDFRRIEQEIVRFTDTYKAMADEDRWVVKGPFTTNCHFRVYVRSSAEVWNAVLRVAGDKASTLLYVMVQPRMRNQFERKVACVGGRVCFVTGQAQMATKSNKEKSCFKAFDKEEAMKFAQIVLDYAKSQLGSRLITEGLFRVDIFEAEPGKFVVNEFESLDADVYGTHKDCKGLEAKLRNDLVKYWSEVIHTEASPIVASMKYSNV